MLHASCSTQLIWMIRFLFFCLTCENLTFCWVKIKYSTYLLNELINWSDCSTSVTSKYLKCQLIMYSPYTQFDYTCAFIKNWYENINKFLKHFFASAILQWIFLFDYLISFEPYNFHWRLHIKPYKILVHVTSLKISNSHIFSWTKGINSHLSL